MAVLFSRFTKQSGYEIIPLLMMLLPALSYVIMMVWMIARQQWMYVFFLLPSLLVNITQIVNTAIRSRAQAHTVSAPSAQQSDQNTVLLSQLAGIKAPATSQTHNTIWWQNLVHAWHATNMNAHIGTTYPHDKTSVNICAQGPHALIAGTTGSGKSVLLQRWVYELAQHNSPTAVQFVFLDFKGGSTFVHAHRLPHCVGNVSNLNMAHAVRAIRALRLEMTRREQLLNYAGVADIRDLSNPPARLIIMADEFFALLSDLPRYANDFSTMVSLGRSLGLHFIISTQNPMNQVSSHIKANMPLHACLRVTDPLQSLDLLGTPVAARIQPDCVGAAFIHDGSTVKPVIITPPENIETLIEQCLKAARFTETMPDNQLFSAPLPDVLGRPTYSPVSSGCVLLGQEDDGITLHPFIIDFAHNPPCHIVLTHMDSNTIHAAVNSIFDSLKYSGAHNEPIGKAHTVIYRAHVEHYSDDLRLPHPSNTLIISVSQWSRFYSSLPADQRPLWNQALIMCPAYLVDSLYIPGRSISEQTHTLIKDYVHSNPLRVIVLNNDSHLVQLFHVNSSKTLEKSATVWLPIEQEKD